MVQRKFDARHEFHGSCTMFLEPTVTTRSATIFPIIMNDDAKGDPMNFKAHPEHASWAEVAEPNCFPDSEIRNMKIICDIIVQKSIAAATSMVKLDYALISCAFPEDLDALDEKSGLTMKEVLELQKETTDRQAYPLWNGTDLVSSSLLGTNVPGLTATQLIEGINFDSEVLRDQLRYGKIKGLLKKCLPIGFRTSFIKGRSVAGYSKRIKFNFTPSNAKFINPYTFLGLLVSCPTVVASNLIDTTKDQLITPGDITDDTEAIHINFHVQYDERNPEFHMGKV